MDKTQFGGSAAARSLLEIVCEQEKPETANRKVSALLSNYSNTASKLFEISDIRTVACLQKMLLHSTLDGIREMFGTGVLATHLNNVLKIRYREFDRIAQQRIRELRKSK